MKRKRRNLKWHGAATSAFILFIWIGTFRAACGYQARTFAVALSVGCIEIAVFPNGTPTQGWFAARQLYEACWLPRLIHGSVAAARTTHVFFPLWIPLLFVGVATIRAFIRDIRIAPELCQTCGYDFRHAGIDTCSECGAHPVQVIDKTSSC